MLRSQSSNIKFHCQQIDGAFFESGYNVYAVEIMHPKDGRYWYIGQTGDSHYPTARSPFYRMSGHFESRQSTQNQIYKKLMRQLGDHRNVEDFLVKCTVRYHVFQLHPYEFIARDDKTRKESIHRPRRKDTLIVETGLIQWFLQQQKGVILNTRHTSSKDVPNTEQEIWIQEIIEYFEKYLKG